MASKTLSPSSWLTLILSFGLVLHPTSCLAQDVSSIVSDLPSTTTSEPSSTHSAAAETHIVKVGLADHKFVPNITTAAIGDTVEFQFFPRNHSVVRAPFGHPCIPYNMTETGSTDGFFSGFFPVSTVQESPPTWRILINNTDPIFFYCSAPGSCITYGMVGAINPNETSDIDKQRDLAKAAAFMLQPGEEFPAEGPIPSDAARPSDAPNSNNKDSSSSDSSPGLSTGAIAGIAIGGAIVLLLAFLLFFCWGRTKSLKEEINRKAGTLRRVSPTASTAMLEQQQQAQQQQAAQYHHHQATASVNGVPMSPPLMPQWSPTPAPSYFSSPDQQHQQMQQQQGYKYPNETTYPLGYSHSPQPSQNTISGAFELGPAGEYTHQRNVSGTGQAPGYFEAVYGAGPGPVEMEGRSAAPEVGNGNTNVNVDAEGEKRGGM